MWIFAYGSIIFRPSFPHLERRVAFVTGWARRFWQGSPDHRGVPDAPGRVVTLVEAAGERCGGCAYRIDPADAPAILDALDAREQAGFDRHTLALEDRDGARFGEGLTWIASPSNAHYLGPLPELEIARYVAARRGPSGPNRDYVLALDAALAGLEVDDPHVAAIARELRALGEGQS